MNAPPANKTLFDVARHYMATAASAVVPERMPLQRFPHFVKDWEDCMRYACAIPGEGWSVTGTVHMQQRYVYAIAETDAEPGIGYVITSLDPVVHRVDLETGEVLGDAECAAAVDVPELEAVA